MILQALKNIFSVDVFYNYFSYGDFYSAGNLEIKEF